MNIRLHIVGLPYHSMARQLEQVYAADGLLREDFRGRSLQLRRDRCAPVDKAVAAYLDGRKLGYVSDDEKFIPWRIIGERTPQSLSVRVVEGSRSKHYIVVETFVSTPVVEEQQRCPDEYQAWADKYGELREMEMTEEEDLLYSEANELERLLALGSDWTDGLDGCFSRFCSHLYLDLSREMYEQKHRILELMGRSAHEKVRARVPELYSVMVHQGSTEMRKRFAREWLEELRESEEFGDFCKRCSYLKNEYLREAVESFPRHLYDDYRVSPDDAIATLYYLHLPARICRLWLSAVLLLDERCGTDGKEKPETKGFSCAQLCILFYYLLNAQGVNFDNSMKKDWIAFIQKVSGNGASNIKDHLEFQKHFDNKRVRQDLALVAETLKTLLPKMARMIRNEMEE